ncbi:MAG: ANTAR domain-containing protein [Allobranchiibius sp.]
MTVHNAHTLSLAMTLTTQLQTALLNRPVIDEAIGLIRSRTGVSSAQARERLQTMSQHEHVKMVEIAQHLVDEAIRRTRARHTGS